MTRVAGPGERDPGLAHLVSQLLRVRTVAMQAQVVLALQVVEHEWDLDTVRRTERSAGQRAFIIEPEHVHRNVTGCDSPLGPADGTDPGPGRCDGAVDLLIRCRWPALAVHVCGLVRAVAEDARGGRPESCLAQIEQ